MFGDSAYFDDDYMVTGGGRGIASVRETIEWTYKDLKTVWKYCDYRHCLKMRNQPLGKIMFVCMLLRNMHITMYGNQNTQYFECLPPTLEEYLGQGIKARPLPEDCVFAAAGFNEEAEESASDSDSDSEDDDNIM